MGRVQSSLVLNDRMTGVLKRINNAMGLVIDGFEAVQRASGKSLNVKQFDAARREFGAIKIELQEQEEYYRRINEQQNKLNKRIEKGTSSADGLLSKIKGIASAYAGMQTVRSAVRLSDKMTQTDARLSMVNDGSQTNEALKDKIFASAQRSRGSYLATADSVSKLGLMAGDAFNNNDEIISFMEQINKQFKIAGTDTQGIDAAMLQLTQAMGSGVLRGEEFNSVLEQAPNIIQSIADYMDVPKGKLKDMAAEGQITADIVKAAMFACADDTNKKFESMPMTWSDIWTSMQNRAIKALDPVLVKINELANSESVQKTVDGLLNLFTKMVIVLTRVFTAACAVYNFISDNWSWIRPIVMGIVGALLIYKGAVLAITAVETIAVAAKYAYVFALSIFNITAAKATATQWKLNAAMYANPIGVIIAGVMLLIVALYALVAHINKVKGTSISATGIILGVLFMLGARAMNRVIIPLWNGIANLANFLGNVFNNPLAAIKVGFYDMCLDAMGYIRNLAHGIEDLLNKIPGISIDITSGLDNFYSKIEEAQQAVKDESGWVEYAKKMDYIDYKSAFDSGYNLGGKAESRLKSIADEMGSISGMVGDIFSATEDIAGNTEKSSEELSYLRDIAEREAINRFTTAEIRVELGGVTNNVSSNVDLDGVISYITDGVADALVTASEGVY